MRENEVIERYIDLITDVEKISILAGGMGDAAKRGDYETAKRLFDASYGRIFELQQKAINIRKEMETGEKPEESQQIRAIDDLINRTAQTLGELVDISLELVDTQQNIQGGQ